MVQDKPKQERMRLILRSFDHRVLDNLTKEILETARKTGARIVGPVPLPVTKRRFTVIRSPHIDKKSREHFELRIHKRLLDIIQPSSKTIDSLTTLQAAPGVDVSIKSGVESKSERGKTAG